jgi:ABC-2 type transport system ATP-binding protein
MAERTGLDVDALSKCFEDIVALDAMSFTVGRGRLVGFLGPNGAGKTTTMRAVMGLLRPDRGEVRWDGEPADATTRRRFGYMPEERGLYGRMPLGDQVAYFAELAGLPRADAEAASRRWLGELGLGDRLRDDVGALSHGNQQRVQLAVALAHDPELLVLDEPLSGLDPLAAETMQGLLQSRAAAGTAVLFSSHQLDMVEELCRDVVIVEGGRVVAAGPVEQLRAAEPTRTLTIGFEPPGVATSWADPLPGCSLLEADADRQTYEVPADLDLAATLALAAREGRVARFSFEPPDLSVVFRNAVSRSGPAASAAPAGAGPTVGAAAEGALP